MCQPKLYSQTQDPPKFYAHKVVVEEVLQTKNYTYLHVKEHIKEMDSLQWLALPLFEPAVGNIYYFESGLQMGEFQSKELNRTFKQILFLSGLSTSAEVSLQNIVPAPPKDTIPQNTTPVVVHTVVVKEVLQTSGYTYLRVKEGDKEEWLAVVKIRAAVGQTFTYNDAATMTNFFSKELNRTFKEVLFLSKIILSTDAEETTLKASHNSIPGSEVKENKNKKIDPVEGVISIATLLENKKLFTGKTVKIRGEVTKFSSTILNKNWIHIEDGTNFSGKSDLTITSIQKVKVGDHITVEGIIAVDKDFGSGYFFDVIMEDAKLQSK